MQISDDQPSEKVISAINERVDEALRMNKKSEYVVVSMAIAIFTLGVAVIIIGYWARNLFRRGYDFAGAPLSSRKSDPEAATRQPDPTIRPGNVEQPAAKAGGPAND
jgi:hypothetical protein